MQMVLNSTFQPDSQTYDALRQRIRRANDFFAQTGPQASILVRFCDQLSSQVNNLEKLVKPKPVETPATGLSLQETAAYESFTKFQESTLQSLNAPLQQLGRWSIVTLVLVALSVVLIIAGAASTLFLNTQVGVLTSISSILSSLISSVLYFQLRQAQREVTGSRRDILQQFKHASERFFAKTPPMVVPKQ